MKAFLIDSVTGNTMPDLYRGFVSDKGNLLQLTYNGMFNPSTLINRKHGMWRYRESIPIEDDSHIVSLDEGYTPLLSVDINGHSMLIKQEQLFSSGSYKDRGASVLISYAKAAGITHVVQDSSGNAGCAIAAYAARAGIRCTVFVQHTTSPAKIAQMKIYGAEVIQVTGTRNDAALAARKAAENSFYASHCYNPYFFHGTKTFAYELCEQLNWKTPDAVVVPAGNGTLLIGCYIGFADLYRAGICKTIPKLIAVQAENCAPLANIYNHTEHTRTLPTIAEGIAIESPVRGNEMFQMVNETGGTFITVNEAEIKNTWLACGKQGFYIEPTSAATVAGASKYMSGNNLSTVVTLFSGHGLKSTEKTIAELCG